MRDTAGESKNKLTSDILPWTPSLGRSSVDRPTITNIQQLCTDTGCSLEDMLEAMDDGDEWRERFRDTRANSLTWGFNIQTDHLISARRPDLIIINKRKRICKIVDFAIPGDHRINLKESEKKDKYLDLARELKKLWNMKVTIVPIVIGTLGTVAKGLLKGLEDLEVGGRVETIQSTALLRTARILRRVLET